MENANAESPDLIGGNMQWKTVQGSQPEKPSTIQVGKDYVFLRKNIHTFSETDPEDETKTISGWEYDEMLITRKQYDEFVKIFNNPLYTNENESLSSRILNLETFIATSTE